MTSQHDFETLAVLAEPQRRRVYDLLASRPAELSVADVVTALGIGRTLAAFHLGKLVEAGFVETVPALRRESGRPGRPSQTYRLSTLEVAASAPARHYDLIAEILLAAASGGQVELPLLERVVPIARARGRRLADETAPSAAPKTRSRRGRSHRLTEVLTTLGYRPRTERGTVVLGSCPFDKLREVNCELVCGINHALVEGYLDSVCAEAELTALLRPSQADCCVVVAPASRNQLRRTPGRVQHGAVAS